MDVVSEKLYYELLLFTLGCSALAFFYHLVLYLQRKEQLLFHYCLYLFLLSLFLLSRTIIIKEQYGIEERIWVFHFWDELLQLLMYFGYVDFVGRALGLSRSGSPKLYISWRVISVSILIIAATHCFLMLTNITQTRTSILFIGSRVLLIAVSLLVLLAYSSIRSTRFQQYILIGSIVFLISGAIAFASHIYGFSWWGFYALSFTFIGEIADVLLFSAAMGYRLRLTYEEKETALLALEEERILNQQKDIERLEAIIETRYQERNRIARELHDEVGSSLSSIHIFSTVASQYLEKDHPKAGEMVKKINQTSGKVMENMSDLVWAISSETDDTLSLIRRIRQFASSILEAKNMHFNIETNEEAEQLLLKTDAKKNILLICKEAVNNAAKYSGASLVEIKILVKKGQLILNVSDNGVGFQVGGKSGNGLLNMKNRCEELKGIFDLISEAGKGSRISCHFPLTIISS